MERDNGLIQTEANVYSDVYRLLIGGMILSNVLFAAGILLALLHPRYLPLTPEWVKAQYQWRTLKHGLATGNPISLMLLATALLILTPVARVIVSIAAFAADRDYKFVVITSVVMLVMLLTVTLGLLGLQ
ncbi:MAG TPA: DUF1634 domain-containing protein [Terriglobales bacterium]|nr:DUF1634 domain-containing protein [Terriglobales bacterium]